MSVGITITRRAGRHSRRRDYHYTALYQLVLFYGHVFFSIILDFRLFIIRRSPARQCRKNEKSFLFPT